MPVSKNPNTVIDTTPVGAPPTPQQSAQVLPAVSTSSTMSEGTGTTVFATYITNQYTTVSNVNKPGGNTFDVQFQAADGSFAGDDELKYDPDTNNLTVLGTVTAQMFKTTGGAILESYSNANLASYLFTANKINASGANSIKIMGGSNGQVLSTDGNGNLSWITSSGGGTANANYANFAGTAYNVSGANVSGSVALANLATLSGTASVANVALSVAGANVTGTVSAAQTASTVTNPVQSAITSVGSLTSLNVIGTSNLGTVGNITINGGSNGQVLTTDGTGNLSWTTASGNGGGNASEITNTDGFNIYSVSVGNTGVVSMNTARGGLEFGAMPEIGGPTHLHIMRPAGQEGSSDLYFGDDYNYVKMPGLYGPGTQGVEIGSSYNSGTVNTWRFGTSGNLTFPDGTTQTTAYVSSNVVTSYKGFSAHYGRMYNSEPTLSKIAIYKDSVTPSSTIDTSTNDDFFQVTGLTGSDIVAMFVIMGSDSSSPTDLPTLRTFTETVIDNVLLNGGVEGDFNNISTMRSQFYSNYSTIAAQAGGLYSNFQFYNNVFQNSGGGTGTTREGSGAVFEIGDNGFGAYTPAGIQSNGTNYLPGHKILVPGTSLGGVTPVNDCIITVDSISGSGQIFQWSVSGVAAGTVPAVYGPVTGTNYQVGSGFVISGVRKEPDGSIQNDGVNVWGTNYVVGDVITLPGTLFTGCTSPDNDLTMTVTSIGGAGEPYGFNLTGTLPIGLWPTNYIQDGGNDQYDSGNFISTDLATDIQYNGGNVVNDSTAEFGSGSSYVVVYQDSIFGILATGASISSIKTDGGSGFDGDGSADTGSLFGSSGGVDIGDFIFSGRTMTVAGSGEDMTIQAPDDLYLDAIDDDIFIRANDDIRLRTAYDFTADSYQWEFRFNSDGVQTWYNNNEGNDYGYIRPLNDGSTRGISVEGAGNAYIKSNWSAHTWTFDNTGSLTIPGNLIASSGASPAPYLSGFSSITAVDTLNVGNVTIHANGVISGSTSIGNVAAVNLNGNVSQVLAGDGTWVAQGGGGTSLPTNASGYLANDGTGTLSWVPGNPSGSGMLPYSDVTVISNTVVGDWTAFSLTGTMDALWDYNNAYANVTLTAQAVYGVTMITNTKILIINDAAINSNDYGVVIEFPPTPAPGDVFSVQVQSDTVDVNAGSFVIGRSYTIKTVGTTNWTAIGAAFSGIGQTFVATGVGSGDGVAYTTSGVSKLIYKPNTGQRARTMNQGGGTLPFIFGQGGTFDFAYIDLAGQNNASPVTWVYAGVIGGVPTWYQSYF